MGEIRAAADTLQAVVKGQLVRGGDLVYGLAALVKRAEGLEAPTVLLAVEVAWLEKADLV